MSASTKLESFIQFLLASVKHTTFTESSRCDVQGRSHDSWRRVVERIENAQEALWKEAAPFVDLNRGYLIADDSILDKPRGPKIECAAFHHSGKHHKRVRSICLLSVVWTDGQRLIPIDFRIFHKCFQEGSKNELLREMLITAQQRGFQPEYVLFDSWYSSNETLHLLRQMGWHYLVGIKSNRVIDIRSYQGEKMSLRLSQLLFSDKGEMLPLRGIGTHLCFTQSSSDRKARYWCTDHTEMKTQTWRSLKRIAFAIEHYHRALKQLCQIEGCQARKANTQRNYISLSIRAFLRLQLAASKLKISMEETIKSMMRPTITAIRQKMIFVLPQHA